MSRSPDLFLRDLAEAAEKVAAIDLGFLPREWTEEGGGAEATVTVEVPVPAVPGLGGAARSDARAEVRPECLLGCPDG